jgi:hypothetical protein
MQVTSTMAKPFTVKSVYDMLHQYARKRPDIGAGKAMLDVLLEPASPFDTKRVRSPKRWFVLLSLLAAFMFACFVHSNRLW